MSDRAIERLTEAQAALIAALDANDAAAIDAASSAVAQAVAQVRAVGGWRATPALRNALEHALRNSEGVRVRANYLADHGRRRLQALDVIGGGARARYSRSGR